MSNRPEKEIRQIFHLCRVKKKRKNIVSLQNYCSLSGNRGRWI